MIKGRVNSTTTSVAYTLYNLVEPLLGNNECVKCIVDDDQAVFTSCAAILLQNLDIQNPVGNIINNAVQTHHSKHGTCAKTLLAMIGIWARAVENLSTDQQIPLHTLVGELNEGIEFCIKTLEESTIELQDAGDVPDRLDDNLTTQQASFDHQSSPIISQYPDHTADQEGFIEIELSTASVPSDKSTQHGAVPVTNNVEEFPVRFIDDDDDVGWFFEEGFDPGPPQLDPDAADLLSSVGEPSHNVIDHLHSRATSTRVDGGNLSEEIYPEKSVPDANINKKSRRLNVDLHFAPDDPINDTENSDSSQIGDEISLDVIGADGFSDSEFDSCFDDLPSTETETSSRLLDPSCTETPSSLLDPSCTNTSSRLLDPSCTNTSSSLLDPSCTETPGDVCAVQRITPPLECDSSSATNHVKLPASRLASSVLNRSRHFKTIESTVEELNHADQPGRAFQFDSPELTDLSKESIKAAECLFSRQPCNSEVAARVVDLTESIVSSDSIGRENPVEDLALKLARSRENNPVSSRIMNRSRHFRTVTSAADELQSESHPSSSSIPESSAASREILAPYEQNECEVFRRNTRHTLLSDDIESYAGGLAHGCDKVMKLAVQAAQAQRDFSRRARVESVGDQRFALSRVQSISLCGPLAAHSSLLDGLVVQTGPRQTALMHANRSQYNALLIKGDVTSAYRHMGHRTLQKTHHLYRSTGVARGDDWFEKIIACIEELSVTALLVTGKVDEKIADYCLCKGVLALEGIKYRALQAVGEGRNAEILSYVTDAVSVDVVKDVDIQPLGGGVLPGDPHSKRASFAVITSARAAFQTAVICHPVIQVAAQKEEDFWHCCHRLAHAESSGRVIAGGGDSEKRCIREIEAEYALDGCETTPAHRIPTPRQLVYAAIGDGLQQFCEAVRRNTAARAESVPECRARDGASLPDDVTRSRGTSDTAAGVYDDLEAKCAAWRTAGHTVAQLLLCDMEVITGRESPPPAGCLGVI